MLKKRFFKVESLKVMGCASKKVMGPNIEVLLWNIFKCKKKGWHEDFLSLTNNRDLIIVQEAILNSPFDSHFKESLQHQWIMASSFKNIKSNIETGVKTGSTVSAVKPYFSASKYSEPISQTKKMLLTTLYPLSIAGESLLVVNCHLINFVTFKKFSTHLHQIFQTLESHDGPLLLAGDFNTWNKKRLNYFNKLATSFSLEEVKIIRKPRVKHLFKHLDHIYYRGVEVVNVHVNTHIHSSDHYPISLSLRTIKPMLNKSVF
jgi:endonuclease/exonuclease/phosphatase (EEP) superfamily protein YafD